MKFLNRLFGEHHEGERIYLDYAAATPLRHEVWEVMRPIYRDAFGNPSSIHKEGQRTRRLIEEARVQVARLLSVRPEDVVFTSGGTEANNLAVAGVLEAARKEGKEYSQMEVITTALEHPSLTGALDAYRARGVVVHEAPVSEDGLIDLTTFGELLNERTVLVATAAINSEIGVIQPTRKLKKLMVEQGDALLLVDGAQLPLWESLTREQWSADILTLDAGKCYGPKGVGVLAWRHGVVFAPTLFGGGQERGLRPGTENAAAIVGAAKAFEIAALNQERRRASVAELREYFFERLATLPSVVVNGSRTQRVANNVNISIPGLDTEFAVVVLDEHGVAASTKSACSGAGGGASAVVLAISGDTVRAASTVRFTLGETSSTTEIDQVVDTLATHLEKVRTFDSSPH